MNIRRFELISPVDLVGASAVLAEAGGSAAVYAGGTELLLLRKFGLATFDQLVDIKRIPELTRLLQVDDIVQIGAAVTHRTLETAGLIREALPLIAEVERDVANVRVRNVGTIGGNLCFAEPHSDLAPVLLLLGASCLISGPGGVRALACGAFVRGAYQTALEPGEILVRIDVPVPPPRTAAAYERFRYHERPTCVAGVSLTASEDGRTCASARVVVGAAGPVPTMVPEAQDLMAGQTWEEVLAAAPEVGRHAATLAEPTADLSGSPEYKAHLVRVFVERAARRAVERLREGGHAR